jgi:hypothetical protein
MMLVLEALGIDVECQHHEVATAGQAEIDMRFKPLLQMGDQLMWFKYVLKNVAYPPATPSPSCPSRCLKTTAPACTPTQHLERRAAAVCR